MEPDITESLLGWHFISATNFFLFPLNLVKGAEGRQLFDHRYATENLFDWTV